MRERIWQFGGITTNVLLPWLLLSIMVAGLTGYRFQQARELAAMQAHIGLLRQAVRVARDLRFLAQERWSNALAYQATRDPSILLRLRQSETETRSKLVDLNDLFSKQDRFLTEGAAYEAHSLLHSYRTILEGHFTLYAEFITAIDAGNVAHQVQLVSLLSDKIRLVRAALDDLATYHTKAEQLAVATQQIMQRRAVMIFFGLLGALILVGLGLSVFQTRAITRPLRELTLAARKVGAGDTADLSRFEAKGEIGELGHALTQMVAALHLSNLEVSEQRDQLAQAFASVETQVKERTAELQHRTQELETANKDLEGFSYSVSHDLRATLRDIDGNNAVLLEDYGPKLDAEGLRLFGIVQQNAKKMGQLIDDILAFSRAGRLDLEFTRVDMNAMVDSVWAGLAEQRGERAVEFHRADLPVIAGDPRALRQVWQNLLDNAIKFTRDRNPARIEVGAASQDGMIWLEVKDNGAGFNEEYKDKLFGLFLRLHGMDEFEGTGVGLAIVKRFIQKHGGRVMAEGAVGAGASFRFCLPADRAPPTLEKV